MSDTIAMCFPVHFWSVGQFVSPEKGWTHPERTLNNSVLIVPTSGKVYIEESGEKYTVQPGNAIILRAYRMHRGWKCSEGLTVYYYMHFEPRTDFGGDKAEIRMYWQDVRLEQVSSMLHMLMYLNKPSNAKQSILDYQTSLILMACGMVNDEESKEIHCHRFVCASEWLKRNACRNITIRDVAREFGYNPDYLSRLFREQTGVSMKQYITQLRISTAKQKLLLTNLKIKQIAARVGFDDDKYFLRVFKEVEKMTPGQYRALYSALHQIDDKSE